MKDEIVPPSERSAARAAARVWEEFYHHEKNGYFERGRIWPDDERAGCLCR
jgi:hypothetical protein